MASIVGGKRPGEFREDLPAGEVIGITEVKFFTVSYTDSEKRRRSGIFMAFGKDPEDGELNVNWLMDDNEMAEQLKRTPKNLVNKIRGLIFERYGITWESLAHGHRYMPNPSEGVPEADPSVTEALAKYGSDEEEAEQATGAAE